MNEFNLDFLRDTQGNYILKTKIEDESQYRGFFKTTGTYSENLIISTKYFEKKLKHNLDDMVIAIEQAILHKQKVIYDDIIYERFVASVTPEEEFNPLFKTMVEEEIEAYTENSRKVKVEVSFEVHTKSYPHLMLRTFLKSVGDFIKGR